MDRVNKRAIPHLQDFDEHRKRSCCYDHGFKSQPDIEAVMSAEDEPRFQNIIRHALRQLLEIKPDPSNRCLSETLKFKLSFRNQIASTIFTGNEIVGEDGKPLEVEICDAIHLKTIQSGTLSTAQIELVVLPGEFNSHQPYEEIDWTVNEFDKNVLSAREGKRPLIVGNGPKPYLKNGVTSMVGLSFTDNSSWTKSKKFRLGAKVIDKKILVEFPRIGEALSQSFKVLHQRGEVYKKHCHPRDEDEVWRLKGISKDGVYHNRLSSNGIKTVGDFWKTFNEKGDDYLKKLFGKVPNKTWKAIVHNARALEGVPNIEPNLVRNDAMGDEAFHKMLNFELQNFDFIFEGYLPMSLPHGEASTSNSHNHEEENTSTDSKYY